MMQSRTIIVRFRHTGEHFIVPVSSNTMIKDIIKYVCEQSIIHGKIDYNDYYLVLLNKEAVLDDDKTFGEMTSYEIENPDYQVCMKTSKLGEIVDLFRTFLVTVPPRRIVEPQIIPDDTEYTIETENNKNLTSSIAEESIINQPINDLSLSQIDIEIKANAKTPSSISVLLQSNATGEVTQRDTVVNTESKTFCGLPSNKNDDSQATTSTNSESNMNNPCSVVSSCVQPKQEESTFSTAEVTSSSDASSSTRPEKLANTYQHFTAKVSEIGAKTTRDPMAIHNITETFNQINILICGASRVGKSTLINAICEKQLAKTSAGLRACTNKISPYYLKGTIEINSGTINYQYNFWDTPGIETWSSEEIRKTIEGIKQKPKSDILCMIYCASPGSYAKLEQIDRLLKECMDQHIFCALVCTNKCAASDKQLEGVMNDFEQLLRRHHDKPREENGVMFFGNMGLCTAVNSERFVNSCQNVIIEPSGIDELIVGIMESLDDEKLLQWCTLALENKKFWKNLSNYPIPLKTAWNKLLHKK
ncbi:unnamed protein product [Rotaria socialis]|uniref:G domain-containing protein n=2 Tax=Rotaria socialis TaxID=392032 RepID=A0A818C2H7_9BILA|nr:unnamed protein product [Rotaria socialis]CAF4499378.1 unnamed protein product [Rotaria socialis]CAF4637679.1 unnamed protein product [Rotaria socialis]